jgi:apolipoprotein N-acyltransferase
MFFKYLPFLSSIMLMLAFRFSNFGWLAFIAIVPIFFFIKYANKNNFSSKKKLLYLYSSNILFWTFVASFIIGVKPELWAGIRGNIVTSMVYITWIMVILFWSLSSLAVSYYLSRKSTKLNNLTSMLIILPLLWSLADYLNSWLFSFVVYGHGGSLGPFWNFGFLGFQIADTPLSYINRFIGLFGSTALVVIINVCVYYMFLKKYRPFLITLSLSIIVATISYIIYQPNGQKINVAAIQVNSGDNGNYLPKIQSQSTRLHLSQKKISLLVIPEGVGFFLQPQSSLYANSLAKSILNKTNGISVAGGEPSNDGYKSERIIYRNQDGGTINEQEKNFLIPDGEYSPYYLNEMFSLFNKDNLRTQYQIFRDLKKGRHPEYPYKYNSINYGTLSCSGIIAPQLYQEMTKKGSNILIDSAELDILRNSPNFFNQTRQIAKFQTIANARPFVQATYGGYSYIYNSNGNAIAQTKSFKTNIISGTVKTSSKKTIYSLYGELIVPISVIVLTYYGLGLNKKTVNKSNTKTNSHKQ